MSAAAAGIELVTIGDELLYGEHADDNGAWLGRRLAADGVRVLRRTTVGDDETAIRDAVGTALDRAAVVLCTGGLGPTPDDRTRPALAALFGRSLRVSDEVLSSIRARFTALGREMPPSNRVQAEVPDGATVFPNAKGTAPGLALEDDAGRVAIALPGVPREMQWLVERYVLPYLLSRVAVARPILHRVIRTTGIPESRLSERIADLAAAFRPIDIASLPTLAGVDLRLTVAGTLDAAEARAALDAAESALRDRLGSDVYGSDREDLAAVVGSLLSRSRRTLALAESCTGGLIAKRLTDAAGASAFFLAGAVTYSDRSKEVLLGVRPETIATHGAVSEPTVREMATGIRRVIGSDHAVAVTGIAGPGGGSAEKPVGTVWFALADEDGVESRRFRFPGDRDEIRERAAQAALALLRSRLVDRAAP